LSIDLAHSATCCPPIVVAQFATWEAFLLGPVAASNGDAKVLIPIINTAKKITIFIFFTSKDIFNIGLMIIAKD